MKRTRAESFRLTALYAGLLSLALLSSPQRPTVFFGATFVLIGAAVRLWAAGHLIKTRELITSGPYRFTRNPLYLGRLLIFTGFALMAWINVIASLGVLVVGWAVFFGYYLPRKERIEPTRLAAIHGERYRDYFRSVPALFPTCRPWPADERSWSLRRLHRNREVLTLLGLVGMMAFFLYKSANG